MQPGSEDIVQMFLLCAVVLALSSHSHSEYVAVELQTAVGIAYDDRRGINAKEHFVAWTMPFVQALVRRKLENFPRVTVRVLVPLRQALRSSGRVFHFVLAQQWVGLIHVADDDGYVLEGAIVAVSIHGDGPALGGEVLSQLYVFIPKPHPDYVHPQPEDPLQVFVSLARHFRVRNLFEGQDFGIEINRSIQVGHGHAYCVYAIEQWLLCACQGGKEQQSECNRSSAETTKMAFHTHVSTRSQLPLRGWRSCWLHTRRLSRPYAGASGLPRAWRSR